RRLSRRVINADEQEPTVHLLDERCFGHGSRAGCNLARPKVLDRRLFQSSSTFPYSSFCSPCHRWQEFSRFFLIQFEVINHSAALNSLPNSRGVGRSVGARAVAARRSFAIGAG